MVDDIVYTTACRKSHRYNNVIHNGRYTFAFHTWLLTNRTFDVAYTQFDYNLSIPRRTGSRELRLFKNDPSCYFHSSLAVVHTTHAECGGYLSTSRGVGSAARVGTGGPYGKMMNDCFQWRFISRRRLVRATRGEIVRGRARNDIARGPPSEPATLTRTVICRSQCM